MWRQRCMCRSAWKAQRTEWGGEGHAFRLPQPRESLLSPAFIIFVASYSHLPVNVAFTWTLQRSTFLRCQFLGRLTCCQRPRHLLVSHGEPNLGRGIVTASVEETAQLVTGLRILHISSSAFEKDPCFCYMEVRACI